MQVRINGKGINKHEQKAFEWFLESANQGNSQGQYNLGCCYENGLGTERDIKNAIRWYEIALGNGYEGARSRLIRLRQR